ncbi:MAG: hypothetical protein KF878_15000 [Planctomycetes bacterium]|nr:hypothetical protein [Planctomycetota bacterium]
MTTTCAAAPRAGGEVLVVVVQGSPPGTVPVRCALCHDALGQLPPPCPGCRTLVHPDCRAGGPCPTLGCAHGRAARRVVVEPWEPSPCRRWTRAVPALLAAAGLSGLCLVVVVINVAMGTSHVTCVERERSYFRALHDAADLFRVDRGRYPEHMDELRGYLREWPPTDSWANPYVLQPHERGVAFVSPGLDDALGTDDDIHCRDLLGCSR